MTDPEKAQYPMLDGLITPDDLAKKLGVSARLVRSEARLNGTCIVVGKKMYLTPDDVAALLEVWRPAARNPRQPPRYDTSGSYETLKRIRARLAKKG